MAGKYEKKRMPSPDKNNSKSIVVPSRKKKLIFITSIIVIIIILVGIVASIYLEETKDIRRMKSHTQGCIEDLEQIQNELYTYTPISNNRRFYSYSASSFAAAGRGIAWLWGFIDHLAPEY